MGRILTLPPERRSPTRQALRIVRKRAGSEIGAPQSSQVGGQCQDAPGKMSTSPSSFRQRDNLIYKNMGWWIAFFMLMAVLPATAQEALQNSIAGEKAADNRNQQMQSQQIQDYTFKKGDFRMLILPSLGLDWNDNINLSQTNVMDDYIVKPAVGITASYPFIAAQPAVPGFFHRLRPLSPAPPVEHVGNKFRLQDGTFVRHRNQGCHVKPARLDELCAGCLADCDRGQHAQLRHVSKHRRVFHARGT